MSNSFLNDHDLESLRRSLAMLQVGQMALTREQGIELIAALIESRAEVRQLRAQLSSS